MPNTYASSADLDARLAPDILLLLTDDNTDGIADTEILNAALAASSAFIDQSLAGRYITPLNPAPAIATRWCLDLAAEQLYLRKREALPNEQKAAADLTRRALESIADGLSNLAGATPRLGDFESENLRRGEDPAFDLETLELY